MANPLRQYAKPYRYTAIGSLLVAMLLNFFSHSVLAQTEVTADPADSVQVQAQIMDAAAIHQTCINGVMSTLESAIVKRQQITANCTVSLNNMVAAFPDNIQPMIRAISERRIETVLSALQQAETVTLESATDVSEVLEELDALETETAADPS